MSQVLAYEDRDAVSDFERQMYQRSAAVDRDAGPPKTSWKTAVSRTIIWAIIAAFVVSAFGGLFGAPSAMADDEEDEINDQSFYNLSSHLTEFFSSKQEPDADSDTAAWDQYKTVTSNAGTAGSFIGYLDVGFLEDPSNWIVSNLSGSSTAMSYDTFAVNEDGSTVSWGEGFQDYAYFGAALNDAGLDSTRAGLGLTIGNAIMGSIMWVVWILSYLVDLVFWLVVQLLRVINPFGWFYEGVQGVLGSNAADGMVAGQGPSSDIQVGGDDDGFTLGVGGVLDGLIGWIAQWYDILYSMAWTVIVPIFIAIFLFSLFMFKKMDKGSATKKFVVRLMFLAIGLPIIGSIYSGALNSMADELDPAQSGSAQVVMSSYVDFEAWARKHRLAVPEDAHIGWDYNEQSVTDDTLVDLRSIALDINRMTYDDLTPLSDAIGGTDQNAKWSEAAASSLVNSEDEGEDTFSAVNSMLGRYISSDQITAASLETEMKAWMAANASRIEDNSNYNGENNFIDGLDSDGGVTALFQHVENYDDVTGEAATPDGLEDNPMFSVNPLVAVQNDTGLQGYRPGSEGGHAVSGGNDQMVTFSSAGVDGASCGAQVFNSDGKPMACNLAPMAMFNYLNTSFSATELTSYSSGNSMSEATRQMHNSVNSAGTGVMGFAIWMNSVVLLTSFVLIGFGYAIGMLIGAFRRTFQLIAAIPFAALGAISAIAKVIIYTAALLLQTLGTIFIYMFVQQFLIMLPQIIEIPFANLMTWADGGFLGFISGSAVAILTMVISIGAVIAFTIMALRLRGGLTKAIEETVTKLVEKFLDTDAGPAPGSPGSGGSLGGGLAAGAGAGMAAAGASQMMGGSGNKNKKPNVSGTGGAGSGGRGPGGVKTAGMMSATGGPFGGKSEEDLTAAERAKVASGDYGSSDPNDPNYNPDHPMSPDYAQQEAAANGQPSPYATDDQGNIAYDEQGRPISQDQSADGQTVDGQERGVQDTREMSAAETKLASERLSKEGLDPNGNESAAGAADDAKTAQQADGVQEVKPGQDAQGRVDDQGRPVDADGQPVAAGDAAQDSPVTQYGDEVRAGADQDGTPQAQGQSDEYVQQNASADDHLQAHQVDASKQEVHENAAGQEPSDAAGKMPAEKLPGVQPTGAAGAALGKKPGEAQAGQPATGQTGGKDAQGGQGADGPAPRKREAGKAATKGAAKGAAKGAVVGGVRGVAGGPAGIAAGATTGAAAGAGRGAAKGVATNEVKHQYKSRKDRKSFEKQQRSSGTGGTDKAQRSAPKPRPIRNTVNKSAQVGKQIGNGQKPNLKPRPETKPVRGQGQTGRDNGKGNGRKA